jgi:hypothetical protein
MIPGKFAGCSLKIVFTAEIAEDAEKTNYVFVFSASSAVSAVKMNFEFGMA